MRRCGEEGMKGERASPFPLTVGAVGGRRRREDIMERGHEGICVSLAAKKYEGEVTSGEEATFSA